MSFLGKKKKKGYFYLSYKMKRYSLTNYSMTTNKNKNKLAPLQSMHNKLQSATFIFIIVTEPPYLRGGNYCDSHFIGEYIKVFFNINTCGTVINIY